MVRFGSLPVALPLLMTASDACVSWPMFSVPRAMVSPSRPPSPTVTVPLTPVRREPEEIFHVPFIRLPSAPERFRLPAVMEIPSVVPSRMVCAPAASAPSFRFPAPVLVRDGLSVSAQMVAEIPSCSTLISSNRVKVTFWKFPSPKVPLSTSVLSPSTAAPALPPTVMPSSSPSAPKTLPPVRETRTPPPTVPQLPAP